MRVMVVGATGTIGSAIARALSQKHELVAVSRHKAELRVDIADPDSIRSLYEQVGDVDAVISAVGVASFGPLEQLTDADFQLGLSNKLMGQVNLVRLGMAHVRDGGSFTLTSGILAQQPAPGTAAISMVNGGLESFVRAAALEMPRGIRINVVSPGWVSETLSKMGRDPSQGTPADQVALAYVESVEGQQNGIVLR